MSQAAACPDSVVPPEILDVLTESLLLPSYIRDEGGLEYLDGDLGEWRMAVAAGLSAERDGGGSLFPEGRLRRLVIGGHTSLTALKELSLEPALPSLIRLVVRASISGAEDGAMTDLMSVEIPDVLRVSSRIPAVLRVAHEAASRRSSLQKGSRGDFARSANYMGSKRALAAFLLESLADEHPECGAVLDLMCGSGAASAVLAQRWPTWASDAQEFSLLLARIQGGGFSDSDRQEILASVREPFRAHQDELERLVGTFIDQEARILVSEINEATIADFGELLEAYPTYPEGATLGLWNPVEIVERRQGGDGREIPFCLFTAYFANTYFGIRQATEIDSLRFAVEQIESPKARELALGALVVAASSVGTTYGGHFAQPVVGRGKPPGRGDVRYAIEKRSRSVFHEFAARVTALASASEIAPREIRTVSGPWRQALDSFARSCAVVGPRLVYVDAPYKREEAARYYHVLETLVKYGYPRAIGRGKTPPRGSGVRDRFPSEFFTHSDRTVERVIGRIVAEILGMGWSCAWSYASSGKAQVPRVVSAVCSAVPCSVRSYATPFVHKAQGGRSRQKEVTEYVVVFHPRL